MGSGGGGGVDSGGGGVDNKHNDNLEHAMKQLIR